MNTPTSNLVSVDWLNQHLGQSDIVVLDATMKKRPNGESIPTPEKRIPGALPFNFDTEICDQQSTLPHMMPTAEQFEQAVKQIGINQNSRLVIYDTMGIFSSPRAWWMFKVMGHKNVYVLDGGLPKWLAKSYVTESNLEQAFVEKTGDFVVNFDQVQVFNREQVLNNLNNPDYQILDARSHARFTGQEPEPRVELKRGHIPNSTCLPFTELMQDGVFKDKQGLKVAFDAVVSKQQKQLVFSCGSGVTACVLALAADEVGYRDTIVYDGSWSEWGREGNLPIGNLIFL